MKPDLSAFVLYDQHLDFNRENDFIARIPSHIHTKEKLFEALRHQLQLPQYCGNNWDALSDCLKDLSWIKNHRVVVLHDDLPSLPRKEVLTYLEILYEAVKDWQPGEDHELMVAFPKQYRDSIADILGAT